MQSGDLAFRISDTSQLLTTLRVPQSELARFSEGLPVVLQVPAAGDETFRAAIDRISPVVDCEDGSVRMTIYVDNRDGLLAPGMFARIDVLYEKFANAIVVPSAAVVLEDGTYVAYVVKDGIAKRREVVPGARSSNELQIKNGIRQGEKVISDAVYGIRDGVAVTAVHNNNLRGS